jgi:hypothetical protein
MLCYLSWSEVSLTDDDDENDSDDDVSTVYANPIINIYLPIFHPSLMFYCVVDMDSLLFIMTLLDSSVVACSL